MRLKHILLGSIFGMAASLSTGPFCAFAADDHVINMQEADIRTFIENVMMVTGRTFLVDPRVQGKVTINSEETLNDGEVFAVFKDVMRVHGYAVTRTATGEYRITLLQGAAQDAPLSTSGNGINGQLATSIFKLKTADAAAVARLIKPIMHSQGVLTANPGGKVVVVTDFAENLRKAREIIKAVDVSNSVRETVQLRQLSVVDAKEALKELGGAKPAYKVVAIEATNSLVVEGTPEDVAQLKSLLSTMDVGSPVVRGAVSVVPLRFANGSSIVELLTSLLPSYTLEGQPAPTVAYEANSNTLVISADGETQAALESIIRRLDQRRPQVLVEAIIVEISTAAVKELGVQFAVGGLNGNTVPLVSSNFSRTGPNLLALAGAIGGEGLGLTETARSALETSAVASLTGLDGGSFGVGGIDNDTLFSVIINALETDEDSNILSTPFVTTLDNVPATFLVGQEIPITTGESLGSNNVNPFRTFEREEVGIQLDVLPQISEGDVIRLEIEQEVSSIAGVLTSTAGDFVTNKRKIGTTVLANDGEIIVLGGLLQDDEQIDVSKVPILGDIPVAGKLFRSKGKQRTKTNLMVFLRPTIIRNAQDARTLTQDSLNRIRQDEMDFSGRDYSKIDQVLTPTR